MTEFLIVDAISCIDGDLIERYITMKDMLRRTRARRKKHRILKWSALLAACLIVVISVTFMIPYIPVRYDLNYRYGGENGQEIYTLESNVWVYYVDGSDVKRERVTLPCNAENIFITWKYLNGIGDDVELIDYEIVNSGTESTSESEGEGVAVCEQGDTFVLNITVSETIRSYGSGADYENLIASLKKSMTDYSKIDFDEVRLILK